MTAPGRTWPPGARWRSPPPTCSRFGRCSSRAPRSARSRPPDDVDGASRSLHRRVLRRHRDDRRHAASACSNGSRPRRVVAVGLDGRRAVRPDAGTRRRASAVGRRARDRRRDHPVRASGGASGAACPRSSPPPRPTERPTSPTSRPSTWSTTSGWRCRTSSSPRPAATSPRTRAPASWSLDPLTYDEYRPRPVVRADRAARPAVRVAPRGGRRRRCAVGHAGRVPPAGRRRLPGDRHRGGARRSGPSRRTRPRRARADRCGDRGGPARRAVGDGSAARRRSRRARRHDGGRTRRAARLPALAARAPGRARGRLYVIASHGYETEGVGSELAVGDGPIGLAAQRGAPVRIGALQQMAKYGRTVRRSFEEGGADPVRDDPPAEPSRRGRAWSRFPPWPRPARRRVGGRVHRAGGLRRDRRGAPVGGGHAAGHARSRTDRLRRRAEARPSVDRPAVGRRRPVPRRRRLHVQVRCFGPTGRSFIDGDYLIKGVAGRILAALVRAHEADGRVDFTNRELRLDPSLELPEYRDNLESRLILLKRRLDERASAGADREDRPGPVPPRRVHRGARRRRGLRRLEASPEPVSRTAITPSCALTESSRSPTQSLANLGAARSRTGGRALSRTRPPAIR